MAAPGHVAAEEEEEEEEKNYKTMRRRNRRTRRKRRGRTRRRRRRRRKKKKRRWRTKRRKEEEEEEEEEKEDEEVEDEEEEEEEEEKEEGEEKEEDSPRCSSRGTLPAKAPAAAAMAPTAQQRGGGETGQHAVSADSPYTQAAGGDEQQEQRRRGALGFADCVCGASAELVLWFDDDQTIAAVFFPTLTECGAAPEGGDLGSGAATQLHRGESCGQFNDSKDEEPPQMTTSSLRRRDLFVLSITGVQNDAPEQEERGAATLKVAVSSEVDLETSEGQVMEEGTAGGQGTQGTLQKRRGDRHNELAGSSKN
ncbi:hypothetical protein CBR_g29997 [Chara braunii]|uniref:Uncharacterized protein n=1 Tax=Chara braunii TaxID=69332 RepID=A0A388LC16_CHABU|nr:hypothetical protein CBR_g29997 [Chara braunii]|eukprot:GBG79733.1 hypothetical protein CBR_g29997 [Chara braunii]